MLRFYPFLCKAVQNVVRKVIPEYLTSTTAAVSSPTAQATRDFAVALFNLPAISRVRELRTAKIGQLASVSGTVTRTSEVRPELLYGTFACRDCHSLAKDIEQQFKYTEVTSERVRLAW